MSTSKTDLREDTISLINSSGAEAPAVMPIVSPFLNHEIFSAFESSIKYDLEPQLEAISTNLFELELLAEPTTKTTLEFLAKERTAACLF